jgi:hypothetical protein
LLPVLTVLFAGRLFSALASGALFLAVFGYQYQTELLGVPDIVCIIHEWNGLR